jgi:hypothetical protein
MELSSDDIEKYQGEVIALITAWVDRGLSPGESAMIISAVAHAALAKCGFTLGQLIKVVVDGWEQHNGKL